jgi:predicted PurR-regulated permease PerM
MKTYEHPLSWQAIGRIVLTILIILMVWKIFDMLIVILVSAMLATALYPIVKKLQKRMPLSLATLLVVLLLLVPFVIMGATLIPSFATEFPKVLETLNKTINQSTILPSQLREIDLTQYAENIGNYLVHSTAAISGAVTATITVFFLTFYLIYDSERLLALLLSIFPKEKQKKIAALLKELGEVNGQYIRGNLLISLICGVVLYIGLLLLNIPFAAPLAIFAAITDLLPLIGSTLGMIPAVIIAFGISPLTAVFVIALYLIYQQIESSFLAPIIYNKTLNLSPALGFLAVIIGGALYGIAGAFLALPIAASLPAVIKYVREDWQENEENEVATKKQLKKYRQTTE